MKKMLAMFGIIAMLSVGLVACDFAEGIDHTFGSRAETLFLEIDEDTMEMEISDRDDVANFDLVAAQAQSEREKAAVNGIEGMLKLQTGVVAREKGALAEYMQAREAAIDALGLDGAWHYAPDFEFIED